MPDRDAEVALARSAAAASVSAAATVLVLGRHGFVEAARGTNGFTCVVLRSFNGRIGDPDFWNPRVRAPHCFNAPAARTVLVESLARAEWVLDGVSVGDIAARTVIDGSAGDADSPILVLLIPVHRWSDGTPASSGR